MSALVEQIAVYLVTNERVGVPGAMSEAMRYVRSYKGTTQQNATKTQHKSLPPQSRQQASLQQVSE